MSKDTLYCRLQSDLEDENVAYDINGYPAAPPGIRIYTGATVEKCNLKRLLPWLDHSYYLFMPNY